MSKTSKKAKRTLEAQPSTPTKMPEYNFQSNSTGSYVVTHGQKSDKPRKVDLTGVVLNLN